MQFKWKEQTGRYQNGECLYIKNVLVGECNWNVTTETDKKTPYCISTKFPFKLKQNRFNCAEQAKKELEDTIEFCLNYLVDD